MTTVGTRSAIQDPHRLEVLRDTRLLETLPEDAFDRFTQLAARSLHVPVALICLTGEDREFHKSSYGLPNTDPITGRFCREVIASPGPLVVDDARNHPLSEDPRVGAYAAVPLEVSGAKIGSFSVIDFEPRQWSASELRLLELLARSTACEIELRAAIREADVPGPSPSDGHNRPRIIVAEDDASMRRMIVHMLSGDGFETAEARDGREALQILQDRDADLIVLDLVMPNLTGWDVLAERARNPRLRAIPVIVVSARRGPDVARALAFGIYGLLPKPFNPAELRDLVTSCFAEKR